jgi:hypothetical protein
MRKILIAIPALMLFFAFLAPGLVFGQSLDDILETPPKDPGTVVVPPNPGGATPNPVSQDPEALWIESKRTEIVNRMKSMIGQVDARPGPDGFKKGWEHLLEFYQVAYRLNDIEVERPQWVPGLKAPNEFCRDKNKSWCGIFTVWAWRMSGVDVHWNAAVQNGNWIGIASKLDRGDIIILKYEVNDQNHHLIVKERIGNQLLCISGNGTNQAIGEDTYTINDIIGFHSLSGMYKKQCVPPPGRTKPVTTPPTTTPPTTTPPNPNPATPEEVAAYLEYLKTLLSGYFSFPW